ncbi:hypothetical protein [Ahrensia sp. 13_GOM-1096m]|uniref:hypothetical protein n=1 Tax=Ahrensia sp. 13_GOM-1096m TaxID=1380380 RepID=UPI0012DBEF92|nr:hypothetical protein [Ahrensia sp. 13_GOM-1096m]
MVSVIPANNFGKNNAVTMPNKVKSKSQKPGRHAIIAANTGPSPLALKMRKAKNIRNRFGTRMDAPPNAGKLIAAAAPNIVASTINRAVQYTDALNSDIPIPAATIPINSRFITIPL